MKGIKVDCLEKLVIEKYGQEKWNDILKLAGVADGTTYPHNSDVTDEFYGMLMGTAARACDLSNERMAEAYGYYWISTYIPPIYPDIYECVNSAKEFLLRMDSVHASLSERLDDAAPPRHSYEWKDANTLVMGYQSPRNMIAQMMSTAKGVAKYYNEQIAVRKIDEQHVEIVFAA